MFLLRRVFQSFFVLVLLVALTACGGGGGGGGGTQSQTIQGQFIDSAVSGLKYTTSSGLQGTTDSSGTFSYKPGDTVKFYIGDILIGEASGAAFLTPISLVPGASDTTNTTVQNIARFLQTLDSDGNPSNGITISSAVFNAAAGMSLNFTLAPTDFDTAANALLGTIYTTVGTTTPTLVTSADAITHLTGSLLCGRVGSYSGTYTGDSSGTWSIVIDSSGVITGSGQSSPTTQSDTAFTISGTLTGNGTLTLVGTGTTTIAVNYSGNITMDGNITGTWATADSSAKGTFSGSRVSGTSSPCSGSGSSGTSTGNYGSVDLSGDISYTGVVINTVTNTVNSNNTYIISAAGGQLYSNNTKLLLVDITFGLSPDGTLSGTLVATISDSGANSGGLLTGVCGATIDCSAVSVDVTTRTVTISSLVVPTASGSIILNGSYTYPAAN